MKSWFHIAVLLCVFTGAGRCVRAQMPVPPPMPAYQPLSGAQLDQLLGPIALYPDPLIAQILPAATFPTSIVLADRYVSGGGDPNQIDQQPWDPSVQALARYPNVLQWMDQNLDWTSELGQAFLYQQQDVMDSIQRLRQSAYNLGNLQSTPQQQGLHDGGYHELIPVDAQVIYVPVYQPAQVYYQTAYGGPFISFGFGCATGPWLNFDFDWGRHHMIAWDRDHPRPADWWREPSRQRDMGHTTVWQPENNRGATVMNRGDRGWGASGWGAPVNQSVVATVGRSMGDTAAPRRTPVPAARPEAPANRYSAPVTRPRQAPFEFARPAGRPESNGAFIGIQSSQDTRAYSNRGQQSMQTTTHPTPAARSEPVSRPAPSGGGGGFHGSNSQPRH